MAFFFLFPLKIITNTVLLRSIDESFFSELRKSMQFFGITTTSFCTVKLSYLKNLIGTVFSNCSIVYYSQSNFENQKNDFIIEINPTSPT